MAKTTELVPAKEYAVMQADTGMLGEILAEAAGAGGINPQTDLDRVKIPASGGLNWAIPTLEGEDAEKEIIGVIIHHQDARAYWATSIDQSDGNTPPDCSSADAFTGTGDPGGDCATCPMAQFGSKDDGVGQACKAIKNLFILTPDSMLPLCISLPPSSLKAAKQYLIRLASKGMRSYQVMTKITLENDKSKSGIKYSKAKFEMAEKLEPETAARMGEYAAQIKPAIVAVAPTAADVAADEAA